jgi:hypothetical protein
VDSDPNALYELRRRSAAWFDPAKPICHYRWKTAPASVKVHCDLKASIDVVR